MWQPLADRLEVSSYAVDWYSIAETSGPDAWRRWASPAGLARAAMCMLDELGLESVDVIGNSVGGIVAQILASERPALVRRLVLIGTGASLGGRPTAFGSLVRRWVDQPEERTSLAGSLVDALVARPLPAIDPPTWTQSCGPIPSSSPRCSPPREEPTCAACSPPSKPRPW